LNARAVAAWSATCIFIVLSTTNPAYKALVLVAALAALATGIGLQRTGGVLIGVGPPFCSHSPTRSPLSVALTRSRRWLSAQRED